MDKEFTFELAKHNNGQHSLVLWATPTSKQFVVCSYYDPSKKIGSQWTWGHYFNDITNAVEFFNEQ